jgi:hypothetical protein
MEHGNDPERPLAQQGLEVEDMEVIAEEDRVVRKRREHGRQAIAAGCVDRWKRDGDGKFRNIRPLPRQGSDQPAVVDEAAGQPGIVLTMQIGDPHLTCSLAFADPAGGTQLSRLTRELDPSVRFADTSPSLREGKGKGALQPFFATATRSDSSRSCCDVASDGAFIKRS